MTSITFLIYSGSFATKIACTESPLIDPIGGCRRPILDLCWGLCLALLALCLGLTLLGPREIVLGLLLGLCYVGLMLDPYDNDHKACQSWTNSFGYSFLWTASAIHLSWASSTSNNFFDSKYSKSVKKYCVCFLEIIYVHITAVWGYVWQCSPFFIASWPHGSWPDGSWPHRTLS